ncbi:LamG domain-containing protein [Marinigracilibium pacificum]|uniref:LamG domain-containing protein n=1 Tax=Marinigracilibium pacificum TaxID=2729599 RepID=A0A848IVV0_9BACT|nr:LamG domain-containing protein [Marinigracilibium pacificum]NMM48457.1 LamG domain-containing protein [Marinigracilibium pacificum]
MRINLLSKGLLALMFISVISLVSSCTGDEGGEPAVKDIPRDGLVAFYPFNGNANDESNVGEAANGTVLNATLTEDRFGNPNSAYEVDGTDYGVRVDFKEKLQIKGDLTVSVWVNGGTQGDVYNRGQYELIYEPGGPGYTAYVDTNNGAIGAVYYYDDIVKSGWLMVTLTWDNTEKVMNLYYNDKLVSSNQHHDSFGEGLSVRGLMFGDNSNSGKFYDGKIDDAVIYNKKLTSLEVSSLYNQTFTK